MTAESSRSEHLSQPLFHILTEKADSCIHPGSKTIHSSHTHTHTQTDTHALHKHILDALAGGLRGLNTITFSSLLEGRKNSGATRRLLCPCGKTHGRLSQCCLRRRRTRAQLLNRKSAPAWPCAASGPPRCLAASRLREESQD